MTPYSLAALADRPKGARVALPPIEERIGSVVAHRRALTAMLQGLAKETRASVIPELRRDRGLTVDAPWGGWFHELRRVKQILVGEARSTVERLLRLEARRHTERFIEDARRTLGVDVAAVVRDEDLTEALEAALSRNAGLITSLGDDALNRVEQTVYAAASNGTALREVSSQLQRQFEITKSRADLIARDQLGSFNADLNQLRQTQAGVGEYEWLTSRDEKVRSLHASLNGRIYKWGQKTGAEQGLAPGKPVRCRCVGRGIVTF